MTEKKIETLFHEAVVVGNLLEKNLQHFDKSHQDITNIYANLDKLTMIIKQVSLYDQQIQRDVAQQFADEIQEQVNRYYVALKETNLDTTVIEKMIDKYNATVLEKINTLEESAQTISKTLHKNGDAIIAAAGILKKSKIGVVWSITMFGIGVITGALFLAAYPIAEASKTFYSKLKERDESIHKLKMQYETNDETLEFLSQYNITVKHGITDDSWERRSMQFAPMILFSKYKVIKIDEINGYSRIIFKKEKNNDL